MKSVIEQIIKLEKIDMIERDKAILLINGKIREANTHVKAFGANGKMRVGILENNKIFKKLAFLHLMSGYVVVNEDDYNTIGGLDQRTYTFDEIMKIVKKSDKYKGLIKVYYNGNKNLLSIEKTFRF